MKPCPVKPCSEFCRDDHLMCLTHWSRVPRHLQQKVVRSYTAYRSCRNGRLLTALVQAYKRARDAAIAAASSRAA